MTSKLQVTHEKDSIVARWNNRFVAGYSPESLARWTEGRITNIVPALLPIAEAAFANAYAAYPDNPPPALIVSANRRALDEFKHRLATLSSREEGQDALPGCHAA